MAAGLPSWDELISQLAHELTITLPPAPLSPDTLLKIPQYFVNRSDSRRDLMRRLDNLLKSGRERFRKTKPVLLRPVHHYLAQLPSRLYYTTNFDTFLEDELAEQGIEFDVVDSENMARQFSERRRCQVRKIHGSIKGDLVVYHR
ncbi:MAG: SIR2 family protein [Pyrinomonadaceae bacterium]